MKRWFMRWKARRELFDRIERRIDARNAQRHYWRTMDRRIANIAAHIIMEQRSKAIQRLLDNPSPEAFV